MLVCLTGSLQAQMTDDQVVEYVKSGMSAGKGETQIGRELLSRGVTKAQMERLKARYEEGQGREVRAADLTVAGQGNERMRDAAKEQTAGASMK